MKKVLKMFMASCFLFTSAFTLIHADGKIVPEGSTIGLQYGSASASDKRTDHSYNYQTNGKCTGGAYTVVSVFVRNGSGTTMSSDSCSSGRTCEATWFSSGKVAHTHYASSAITQ